MISYRQSQNKFKKSKINIGEETIKTKDCLNRVSATNIFCKENNPLDNNAAFDGYAISSKDTNKLTKKNNLFKIIGSIAAGDRPLNKKDKEISAVEIMTGGIIPNNFDTIIPIEKIKFYPNKKTPRYIIINRKIEKYQHVRFKGSDYKKNDLIIKKEQSYSLIIF